MCELLLHCVCLCMCVRLRVRLRIRIVGGITRVWKVSMDIYGDGGGKVRLYRYVNWQQQGKIFICLYFKCRVCVDSARDEYIGVKNYDISSFLTLEFSDSTRVSLCSACVEKQMKNIPNPGSP